MASETKGSDELEEEVTVTVAVAVTRLPSVFAPMAVMAAVPWLTAVRSPPLAVMVATDALLEAQVTVFVRFRVVGLEL
jgi:hypothetical protein